MQGRHMETKWLTSDISCLGGLQKSSCLGHCSKLYCTVYTASCWTLARHIVQPFLQKELLSMIFPAIYAGWANDTAYGPTIRAEWTSGNEIVYHLCRLGLQIVLLLTLFCLIICWIVCYTKDTKYRNPCGIDFESACMCCCKKSDPISYVFS